MLTVDTRAGSKNLIEPLRREGLDVTEAILPAGDVQILGHGPGRWVPVGIEYKSWADALACMRNGRFAEQARGMRKAFEVSWILLEGNIRVMGTKGLIHTQSRHGWEEAHGRYTYQEAVAWITTMAAKAGILVWQTHSLTESVAWIRAQFHWWTAKEWAEHRAHLDFYQPPESPGEMLEEPSYVQKVASVLPGLGTTRAAAVAEHFASVREMVNAPAEEWRKVKGVGPKVARTLIETIEGRVGR